MKFGFRILSMVLTPLIFFLAIGCGEDDVNEEKENNVFVAPELVGNSWEIVSIDGEMFETGFLKSFEMEQQDDAEFEQEISLISNNWVFEDGGSLTGNLEFKITEKYPGPVATSMTQQLSVTITGTYTTGEKTLKITTEDVSLDATVTLEPKEAWAAQIQGITVEQLEADLAAEAKIGSKPDPSNFIFEDTAEYEWNITENMLTLTHSDEEIIFRKK